MEKITVRKEDLVKILTANRARHRTVFEKALEGYREEAERRLHEHIERVKLGKVIPETWHLPRPQDHTRDYDRVIRMMELSVQDQIVLTESDFAQFVQDDWAWKRQFITSNSAYYSGKLDRATTESYAPGDDE